MIDIIVKLKQLLEPRDRLQMLLLLIPMLLTSVLEMASIAMIIPLIDVVMGGNSTSGLSAKLMAYLPDMNRQDLLLFVAIAFSSFFVVKNVFILAMVVLINWFTHRKMAVFLQRMYELYLRRPYVFHLNRNSAEIQRNLNHSGLVAFDGLRLALSLVMESTLVIAAALTLLLVEPVITLISVLVLSSLATILFFILSPMMRRWGEKSHIIQGEALNHINVSLGAIKDIKVMDLYGYMTSVFRRLSNDFAHYLTLSLSQQHLPRLFIEALVVVGFMILLLVSSSFGNSNEAFISTIGLFGMAAMRLVPSLNRILNAATELRHRTAPINELHNDLMEGLKEAEYPETLIGKKLEFTNTVSIEGLTYTYPNKEEPALKNINLKISKGETIGLVGVSGVGKTTLVDIFLGFLKPNQGHLFVDGKDAFENLHDWRQNLGYVPQHIFLADDTLRRNIAFGIANEEIDEAAVEKAINMALLRDVIKTLPQGLETQIGENGIRLSGGQRQRVGIARILYRNPDILVFDEATSSLDTETEREISASIASLSGKRTMLIIAHRLSTVRKCDRVVFMKDGQINAVGTFDELNRTNKDFRRLVDSGKDESAISAL
jgi:ABC-type multidrug transport system fused ATPase/permease subunit